MSSNKFIARNGLAVGTAATEVVDSSGTLLINAPTATKLLTARTISLTGDVAGSVSFDGSGNAAISTTIQADSVALGTDTTGNYMVNVSAGTGVSVSHTQGEGSTATVSIGQAVGTTDNVTFNNVTVNGTLTSDDITSTNISVAGNATITGNLTVSGTTTTVNSTTIALADANLELARNATTAAQANGAGITVTGPTTPATITYSSADDRWNLNKNLNVTTVYGALSGNASTATALATGRTIAITGDLTYTSGSFDGTGNVTGAATLATVNSNVGTFGSSTSVPVVTVNAKGLVTAVSTATISGSLTFTGDVTGSGSTGASTALTLATVNSNVGTYTKVTVNGKGLVTAASSATTSDISEGTNLYYTDTRARAAHSFTAGSGAYNSSTGVITIPTNNNQLTNGAGYITGYTEVDTLATVTGRGATTSSTLTSTTTAPFALQSNSNTGTYTQTVIYANQNNTTANTANGIFIERGRLTDSASGEIRYLTIGARGGQIQWQVDGSGNTTQTGTIGASNFSGSHSGTSSGTNTGDNAGVTSVTGTAPVVSSGGTTPAISMAAASSGVNGYMTGTYATKLDGIAAGATNVTNNNQLTNGAGYITGYTETDTLATVTARGATTSSVVRINNQLQVGQNTNGTAYIDAYGGYAWFGRDSNSAGIRIDASGNVHATAQLSTGSYARLGGGTSNPASTGFSHTLAGVSTNRIVNFDGNGNGAPSVWWTSGARAYGAIDAKDPGLTFWANNGSSWQQQFEINYGNVTVNTDIRSPIFYDSNNTAYFVDPNSISTMYGVHVNGSASSLDTANQLFLWGSNGTTSAMGFKSNGTPFNNPTGNGDGYNTYLTMDTAGRGWVFGERTTGFANVYTSGWILNNGIWQANASMRAPIFYDSNDTGYYANPNSFSQFSSLSCNGDFRTTFVSGSGGSTFSANHYSMGKDIANGGWSHPHYSDLIIGYHTGIRIGGTYSGVRFYSNSPTTDANNDGNGDGGESLLMTVGGYVGTANSTDVYVNNNLFAGSSMRAPIYYDSNDTGYYVNPNSTSRLSSIDFGSGGYYIHAGDWGMRNTTPYGWIQFGPANSSWCHIYGSHNIYFNQNTYVSGNWMLYENTWQNGKYFGSDGIIYANASMRAPIFYDQNDTGYYLDPNSTGVALRIAGAIQGNHVNWTGEHNKIQWHSSHMYFQNMNDGYWLFRRSNGAEPFQLHADGWAIATNSWRSPLFYDSNDTAYYIDPNSSSVISGLSMRSGSECQSTFYAYGNGSVNGSANAGLNVYGTGGNGAVMSFHRGGYYAVNMGLDSDNVIRIGGWSAGSNRFQFDMGGTFTAAGNITANSDARLKENIEIISNALQKVQAIRGVTFTRNDQEDKTKRYAGVIAQEVEAILPEVVGEDNLGIKNVAYGNMVGLLIEAIKEQQSQIDELKALVNTLLAK
jgi:hypothetical protein